MFQDVTILGVPLLLIVFGLVEFLKKFDVRGRWLTQMYPEMNTWLGVVVFGLAVGLAASGIYDFADSRWPRREDY